MKPWFTVERQKKIYFEQKYLGMKWGKVPKDVS